MAWYYYAGGAAALAGLALVMRGGSDSQSEDSSAPAGTPIATPLFMASGGGGGSGVSETRLDGNWAPPVNGDVVNSDVRIAEINAGVNMAAIAAAKELQTAAIVNAAPPPNVTTNKTEFRNSNIGSGAAFIAEKIKKIPTAGYAAVENEIYQAAKLHGYSVTETAQSFTAATGILTTPEKVKGWLDARGLTL